MRIRFSITGALLAIMFLAAPVQARTIKVGLILPFSGPNADLGEQMDRAVRLYLKTHPKVPGGHTIEIIRRDATGPKPDIAKRLAQELVIRDKVDVLAGVVYSNNALAIIDVANEAKVPLMIMNAASSMITTKSPYVARTSLTMWQVAYPLGELAFKEFGIKNAAVAYANYASGVDAAEAFKASFTAAGGKIVLDVPFTFPNIPDFTPFLQRIKDAKPDGLYVFVPTGKYSSAFFTTLHTLGLRESGIKLLADGDITDENELPNLGDSVVGLITLWHYSAGADRPANRAFVAEWKREYGADSLPGFLSVGAWDGMDAIYHAIGKTNGAMGADATVAAWKTWKSDSPRGPVYIDPETRDIVQNMYLRETKKVGGKVINVEYRTYEAIKDPWKQLNKKK